MLRTVNALILILLLSFIPSKSYSSVAGEVNKANGLYKQGKFDDSLDLYQEALGQDDKSPVIKYNLGTALYKKGDYTKALGYLEQAAQDKDKKIKSNAEYNLGNVLYKSAVQKENSNVDDAINSLQEALGHYGHTLEIEPKDQDAQYNQDFVKKEIERLKQLKQQQQQRNKQQSKNQKQDQQNQQDQKDRQAQQNQQKEQQENQQNQKSQQNNSKVQENQQSSSGSNGQKRQKDQAQLGKNQKSLDRQQAEDLLEDYQQNEEPKKLLNYMPKKIDDRPVLKDW